MTATTGATQAMASRYDPGAVEDAVLARWDAGEGNRAGRHPEREPFCIMIPPPNVTGVLHMGHALNGTIQDIVARHRRLAGFDVLWLPGTDHAGIATQAVVEKQLFRQQGITRKELGREAFLEHVWAWKEKHGEAILRQFKRLGASCDWSRTRFTLDPAMSRAVREAFVRLWERDLIYRGARLVNWDCALQTAISDDEIVYETRPGKLWTLRYPLADDPGRHVAVATTRPETMLGDTGVAVHPEDARYADLVGRTVMLPLMDREIPIVADESVDPAFGTGAVKVTPGHDPADYERGQRHGLPIMNILESDGTLTAGTGPFAGLTREDAREAVLAALREKGLLEGEQDIEHNVALSDRSSTAVEPLVSEQWFVRMEPLAGPAIEAVKTGALRFQPARWKNVYLDWLENVRDWCISRQLWWGHRIPVWYDEDGVPVASRDDLPLGSPHPVTGKPVVRQDDDVLDTWASSWLWPMATLGWPDQTDDLQRYYPTAFLATAREIIYLWVARMIMAGHAFMDALPEKKRCAFATCYINATVLDAQGRRMSKSLGNGIDPLDMIDQFGADAVRFSLVMLTREGQDTKLAPEKFEMGRNFVNKLWNASRFVLGKAGHLPPLDPAAVERVEDRWILSRLAATTAAVGQDLQDYQFNDAAQLLYRFIWNDWCDWYVEAVKPRLGDSPDPTAAAVLGRLLADTLALLHPLCPFVTEAVWERLREVSGAGLPEMLMTATWPQCSDLTRDETLEADVDLARQVVGSVRKLRQQHDVSERKPARVTVALADEAQVASLGRVEELVRRLGTVETLEVGVDPIRPQGAAVDVAGAVEVFLDLDGLVDTSVQRDDLLRRLGRVGRQLGSVDAKLSNAKFVARAPSDVVERERQRRDELASEKERIEGLLSALSDPEPT